MTQRTMNKFNAQIIKFTGIEDKKERKFLVFVENILKKKIIRG